MTDLIELKCRWRSQEEISPGRYGCGSTKLIVSPSGVTLDICGKCYCRDHEPVPSNPSSTQPIIYSTPTLTQRIVSFAHAIKIETVWRAGGGAAPTEEEKAERRKQCDACSYRDASNDSCTLCGCFLSERLLPPVPIAKLSMSSQSCPLNPPKWSYTGGYNPPKGGGCCGKAKSE